MSSMIAQVDGGSNDIIVNKGFYFVRLFRKKFKCELALSNMASFEGIGIIAIKYGQEK